MPATTPPVDPEPGEVPPRLVLLVVRPADRWPDRVRRGLPPDVRVETIPWPQVLLRPAEFARRAAGAVAVVAPWPLLEGVRAAGADHCEAVGIGEEGDDGLPLSSRSPRLR